MVAAAEADAHQDASDGARPDTPCDSSAPTDAQTASQLTVTVHHHGAPVTLTFPADATLADLSASIASTLDVPPEHQKLLLAPKPGLLKPPFPDGPSPALADLLARAKKVTLMGSTPSEVAALAARVAAAQAPRRPSPIKPATPARTTDSRRAEEDRRYTFHDLRPLPYLPHPDRSLAFLRRLRDDPGIRHAMRTHRFSVPLLTEMDPAAHTVATRDGTQVTRTLGLNRNRGEAIELRLRTDAADGYRDYRTIRRTLCHELAHNVHGDHDRAFWDLCRRIEREVERADYWTAGGRGGRVVGGPDAEFAPARPGGPNDDEGEDAEHAPGWTGGRFQLGGGGGGGSATASASSSGGRQSMREVLAKAAEERMKRQGQQQQQQQQQQQGGSGARDGRST